MNPPSPSFPTAQLTFTPSSTPEEALQRVLSVLSALDAVSTTIHINPEESTIDIQAVRRDTGQPVSLRVTMRVAASVLKAVKGRASRTPDPGGPTAAEQVAGMQHAVVDTVGGTVEGQPTTVCNYLQRLRQLVAAEKRLVLVNRRVRAVVERMARTGRSAAPAPAAAWTTPLLECLTAPEAATDRPDVHAEDFKNDERG